MDWQNPQAAESEDTLASLQQLDPSPIDSPPLEADKQLPDRPRPPILTRASSLGLSGSGHSAVYYRMSCWIAVSLCPVLMLRIVVTRLQRYSSYAFSIFTTFHITNTSIIPLITRSVPASEPYLLLTRPYYQSTFLEPLLITIPLVTHIASGVALRIYRRNHALVRYGARHATFDQRRRAKIWPSISAISISGYILAPLVFGHAFVNRILPWWVEGGSSGIGLDYVSHGFAKHPWLSWVGYLALVAVASGHVVWGWAKWLDWTPAGAGVLSSGGAAGKRRWWSLHGIAAAVATLWMAGGLGVVARAGKATGWIAEGYEHLFAKVPLLRL